MLICQVLLKLQILVDRLLELFLPELFFDGVKLVSEFRLLFSPFFEVLSQVGCFFGGMSESEICSSLPWLYPESPVP